MTLQGAIKQLHELRSAEDMPIYYKPAIAEVINVLLMDTQEVTHGHWVDVEHAPHNLFYATCSVCGDRQTIEVANFCPMCGARMDEDEDIPMEYFENGGI